ncbi:MAG TPA: T9SS type A sorting domain-containing protein, partial [Saprospiraceae bacterium]|nr:T9SS type A sorting domain-containing protein [Saprospiraceae bacterium]
ITRILPDALSSPALIYDPGMNLWRISLPINWRNGQLVVYDLQGKEVFSKKLSKDKMVELTPPIVPGCYFIQVKAEHDTWSDKIVW